MAGASTSASIPPFQDLDNIDEHQFDGQVAAENQQNQEELVEKVTFCQECLEEEEPEMEAKVRCLTCERAPAFCQKCCSRVHKRLLGHVFGPIKELPELCEGIVVVVDGSGACEGQAWKYCISCNQLLCDNCFWVIHATSEISFPRDSVPKCPDHVPRYRVSMGSRHDHHGQVWS
jgi:hypothetical protein